MKCLFVSCRSASVLLREDGDYLMPQAVRLTLNGADLGEESRSVRSLYGLQPDTEYSLSDGEETLVFRTEKESFSLDVRRFGARGDGNADDTAALQAAILCCPRDGRVVVPAGVYRTGPLFLKSHMTLELKEGAELALLTDRDRFPVLPGAILKDGAEYLLGTWEGNPLDCFAAALTGIGVEDVRIIGQGTVDGHAGEGDWWINPKIRRGAWRGRLLYLRDCRDIAVQGITFRNSPAWNLHPCFSERLLFCDIAVEAPPDSPNTDGFDPESCRDVRVYGARFSVGDDCIAIKSGKIYMGRTYRTPCERIEIAWSAMLDGHGGVTVGSEMAGGVREVRVHHCLMRGNDRGLRIKTRRGRGKDAVVDGITFSDVRMDGVKMPLVINCMYFCDPDGHSAWVQSREAQPVDDGTPTVGTIRFERIRAEGCQACVGYILGLPERPVSRVILRDSRFSFAEDAKALVPAMAENVPACRKRGVIAQFADEVTMEGITLEGVEGEALEMIH